MPIPILFKHRETGLSCKSVQMKLHKLIDTEFTAPLESKKKYQGSIVESGFTIPPRKEDLAGIERQRSWWSVVFIRGDLVEIGERTVIKVRMRQMYSHYAFFCLCLAIADLVMIVSLLRGTDDWYEALIMAVFCWLAFAGIFSYNVAYFKRSLAAVLEEDIS